LFNSMPLKRKVVSMGSESGNTIEKVVVEVYIKEHKACSRDAVFNAMKKGKITKRV